MRMPYMRTGTRRLSAERSANNKKGERKDEEVNAGVWGGPDYIPVK